MQPLHFRGRSFQRIRLTQPHGLIRLNFFARRVPRPAYAVQLLSVSCLIADFLPRLDLRQGIIVFTPRPHQPEHQGSVLVAQRTDGAAEASAMLRSWR
jgi:hypothetical protein